MKKKFNVKIYGRKGFNSTKEPYLIDTVNIYINLYECGKWYKSNDVKEIKVNNDILVTKVIFCYKEMECLYFDGESYFQQGGTIVLSDIQIDKEDLDFLLSGKAFGIKFEKE